MERQECGSGRECGFAEAGPNVRIGTDATPRAGTETARATRRTEHRESATIVVRWFRGRFI